MKTHQPFWSRSSLVLIPALLLSAPALLFCFDPLTAVNEDVSIRPSLDFGLFTVGVRRCQISPRSSCIANLKQLDGAKQTWALENKKQATDIPTEADLFGPTAYIREKPECPEGGKYLIRAEGKRPRCTILEHAIASGQ